MFCPECGGEYRPGFTRCHDCDVDLIDRLPDDDGDADDAPQGASSSDLVMFCELSDHYHAAALAEQFELDAIAYVLQYGSAMERVGGRQLVIGRRGPTHGAWRGLCWVAPEDTGRAREAAHRVLEEMRREADSVVGDDTLADD